MPGKQAVKPNGKKPAVKTAAKLMEKAKKAVQKMVARAVPENVAPEKRAPVKVAIPKAATAKPSLPKSAAPKSVVAKKELKKPAPVVPIAPDTAKKALAKEKGAKEAKTRQEIPVAQGPMAQKWAALFKKAEAIESKPYNMKATYAEKTAIVHKVLGWGYIMANRNDRLEVLFKDGIKYLISNYK